MHRSPTFRSRLGAPLAALALALSGLIVFSGGCASIPRSPATSRASAPGAPSPDRQEVLDQALEEVLLAREQARLGLMDEAQAGWDRAVALLAPLAATDPEIARQIDAVKAERDLAVNDAAQRAELDAEEEGTAEEGTEEAAADMLATPEPPLDQKQLSTVDQAAHQVAVDYPISLNDRVYAWIEQWSGRLSGFFAGSLERSGMYIEKFRKVFAEEGLPQDLVYMAHVESGFKTSAYSRAAARGIFQFISDTGRRYGLTTNWWVDERADPEKSCRAAAGYLRDLYAEFGDWYLALAAYNAGEGKVRDVLARTKNKDFFAPQNQRLFRVETRNYVPAILAATLIAKEPEKFGFGQVVPGAPLNFEVVAVPQPTSLEVLASCAQTDVQTLRQLNPALRRHATPPGGAEYMLRVPVGAAAGFAERLAQVPPDERLRQVEHVVQRGETVASIARRYSISTRALQAANQLGRRSPLHAGMKLVVPDRGEQFEPDSRSASRRSRSARAENGSYTVRRGDSLSSIAHRFNVTVADLQSWNQLESVDDLRTGQKIRVQASPRPAQGAAANAGRKKSEAAPGGANTIARKETSAAAAGYRSHVVKAGETLWRISRQYGVAVEEIASLNKLKPRTKLRVGQPLIIPVHTAGVKSAPAAGVKSAAAAGATAHGDVHVVRAGDTLSNIARRYGATVQQLCKLNSLSPEVTLQPGDVVTISRRSGANQN